MRKILYVSLNPNPTPEGAAAVTMSQNPAKVPDKRKVRWRESQDNVNRFKFAGIDLNEEDWPNQRINVSSNQMTCDNIGASGDFEYVIYVIHEGKLYDSIDRTPELERRKPVIRNQ